MKALFGAQAKFYDIYKSIEENLPEEILKESIYLVSDSEYFLNNHYELYKKRPKNLLFEWELTNLVNELPSNLKEIKERYKKYNLWEAIVCDRRLMYGRHTKLKQDYSPRFNESELELIIYRTLCAIQSIIENQKPDIVISTTPSTYAEYLLYFAAKENNLKYLQLKFTKVKNFIIFSENFGARTPELEDAYIKNLKIDDDFAKSEAVEFIKQARQSPIKYEGVLKDTSLSLTRRWFAIIRALIGLLYRSYSKHRSIIAKDNHVPPIGSNFLYAKLFNNNNKRRSERIINSKSLDLESLQKEDYIFFPLHSEPEIAISINGRQHQNQIELLRQIAQSLPFGWKLIVKEHPKSLGYRSKNYYKKLLEIPNLYFSRMDIKPFQIISHSKLVSVISGFVGFEAAILNKPVIYFGEIMFDFLPKTIVRRGNINELHSQIVNFIQEYKQDEDSIVAFVAACMQEGVPVNMYSTLLNKPGRVVIGDNQDFDEHLNILSRHLSDRIRKIDG